MTSQADVRHEVFGGNLRQTVGALLRTGAVRPVARLGAIALWTSGLFVVLVVGMWTTAPWPRRRLAWRNRIVSRWARGMGWIVNMRVTILGERPNPPFFLVANHLGYCDIVLLLGHVHGVFVAKKELNRWPVIGYLTRLVGTIFVDRNSRRDAKRVIESIAQRVATGDGVIVFPEGTSSSGDDVYPMRTALFEWAAQTGKPVAIATIYYATRPGLPPAREAVCWWGDMSFVPHVLQLCQMPGFDATLHFGGQPVSGNDRAVLAVQAREAVARNFVPHLAEAIRETR